ncbi:MAG: Ig-like domain-containing protein [Gloeobacteraceae cyanobacterium ES-bin-144]|nr:Ig-like domain-containing protein [Verrucomicrobiales bacterium]
MEDEFIETMVSLLYYARNTERIQFKLISPLNETDTNGVEGPTMDAVQVASVLKKLALRLDAVGMSDVRFHVPEAAGSMNPFFDEIVKDPVIMGKLDLWAIHKYGNSTDGAQTKISASAYPTKKFWVTETASFSNVLGQLDENPSGILIWDGFDSIYEHAIRAGRGSTPPNDSPGIEPPLISYNTTTHLYTPRKGFYENAQLFKFVSQGAVRVSATNNDANLTTYAFQHPATGRLSIVGRNASGAAITVNGTLSNLPAAISTLQFYRTNGSLDLARGSDVTVSSNAFSVSIPADTYFTLSSPVPKLDTHEVAVDGSGKLVSWFFPQDRAYAHVAKLSADFIKAAMIGPIDSANNKPAIFTHSEYDPDTFVGSGWPNNPGSKHAMLADSMLKYYAFSGDTVVLDAVKSLLDHHLTSAGTTPANYYWANVPWGTGAASSLNYGNDGIAEGVGILEPDKIGELGFHGYLRFYQITGLTKYRDAAIACADALALRCRVGNVNQSPWPFRANAQTGALGSTPEDYCASVAGPLQLFDELIRLNLGSVANYQTARTKVWNWMMTYPMVNNNWANYFEDDPPQTNVLTNTNGYTALQVARYLIERPDLDPNWQAHATGIINWVESTLGGTDQGEPGLQYGARTISEQQIYKFKMASHTGRWAAVCAMLAEKTGDAVLKDKAFRSLNWCSYMARNTGSVIEGPFELIQNRNNWYTDGHGDYIRHFMLAMAAMPEWAPSSENHLLRSTSVVKTVAYNPGNIAYSTFDAASTETFRMASSPLSITANGAALNQRADLAQQGWTYDAASGVLKVRHDAATAIVVTHSTVNTPPTCSLTSPAATSNVAALASIVLVANAADMDGTIAKVEFFNGATKLGEDTTAPYHFSWNSIAAGTYTLTAKATDNLGAQTTSSSVSLVVGTPSSIAFGSNDDGSTVDTMTDNSGAYINACRFPAASSMSVTTIKARILPITGSYKCAIYSDNNGTAQTLLASSGNLTGANTGSGTALNWRDFTLTAPLIVTAGTNYWLAIWSNDQAARIATLPTGQIRYAAYTYGNFPNPVDFINGTGHGTGTFTYSIYAFGNATANAAPTCNAGTTQTITLPANANLTGTASDDGIPAALTTLWNYESGPGSINFGNSSALNTTASFSLPGSYVTRLTAYDGAVTTASNVSITVNDSFAAWAARFNVPANTTDSDFDGLNNLLEYAIDRSPTTSEPTPPGLGPNGVPVSLTFKRSRPELNYIIESSANLSTWTTLVTNLGTVGGNVTYTDTPPPGTTKRFLRLRVIQP